MFTSFLIIPSLWGLSITDFDKIVDFSITLEELTKALETKDFSRINYTKFVILNGIASSIQPDKSFFFLLNPEDILKVSVFINTLKNTPDSVSLYLNNRFSPELREELKAYNNSKVDEVSILKKMTNELKKIFRGELIYDEVRFRGISLDSELKEYVKRDLGTEEKAFINRLLIEAAFPGVIKKITVHIEIVYGVWIGYDEVKSYKSIIEFKGTECFKIFKRRKPEDASPEMVNINSTVLIVAKIIKDYTLDDGTKGWFLEGYYIREVR